MAIEIRELLIKVKIEESLNEKTQDADFEQLKQSILKDCKKEITRELKKIKER